MRNAFWRVLGKRCTARAQAGHSHVPLRSVASVHSVSPTSAFVVPVTKSHFGDWPQKSIEK